MEITFVLVDCVASSIEGNKQRENQFSPAISQKTLGIHFDEFTQFDFHTFYRHDLVMIADALRKEQSFPLILTTSNCTLYCAEISCAAHDKN